MGRVRVQNLDNDVRTLPCNEGLDDIFSLVVERRLSIPIVSVRIKRVHVKRE